jgi:hypothetical protein
MPKQRREEENEESGSSTRILIIIIPVNVARPILKVIKFRSGHDKKENEVMNLTLNPICGRTVDSSQGRMSVWKQ